MTTATKLIRQQYPATQIVVLTSFEAEELVKQAMEAGAIGYLYKDVEEEELVNAIRSAKQGKSVLAPDALQALVKQASAPQPIIEPLLVPAPKPGCIGWIPVNMSA